MNETEAYQNCSAYDDHLLAFQEPTPYDGETSSTGPHLNQNVPSVNYMPPNYYPQREWPATQHHYATHTAMVAPPVASTPELPRGLPEMLGGNFHFIDLIDDYLTINMLLMFCCCFPAGSVAVMKSYACYQAKQDGNVKKAMTLSKEARNWMFMTVVWGILLIPAALGLAIYTI